MRLLFLTALSFGGLDLLSQNGLPLASVLPAGNVLELGELALDTYRRDSLLLVNATPVEFRVDNVRSDCGCTIPGWAYEPLRPGDSTYLVFDFHCKTEGAMEREVEVWLSAWRRAANVSVRASCR